MEVFMIEHDQMVKGRNNLLIAILKEKINVEKLPANLRVYIRKFVSPLIVAKNHVPVYTQYGLLRLIPLFITTKVLLSQVSVCPQGVPYPANRGIPTLAGGPTLASIVTHIQGKYPPNQGRYPRGQSR